MHVASMLLNVPVPEASTERPRLFCWIAKQRGKCRECRGTGEALSVCHRRRAHAQR